MPQRFIGASFVCATHGLTYLSIRSLHMTTPNPYRRWINSSQDMLTCTSSSCRAAICVDISPSLSAESARKLAMQYRQMLATVHTSICPFRSDAERWLLDEGSKKQSEGFVVSPFLLPMADDYVLLEDLAAGGLVARTMIRAAAVQLNDHFERANMGLSKLNVAVPRTLVEFVEKEVAAAGGITSDKLESDADRVSGWIYAALAGELKRSEEDSGDVLAKEVSGDDDFANLVTNVPLLAALGRRPAVSGTDDTSDDAALVECPLCLARISLTSCKEAHAGDAPPMKRQRTSDGDATSSSRQPVDMLTSHRHYCPYVCAGGCNVEGGALPGWKGILGMIGKQNRDKENTGTSSGVEMDKSVSTGEESFRSIRSLLMLPSKPKA